MDLHDIWQEHKRWILGVVGGVIAFVIGNSIIESTFGSAAAERRLAGLVRSLRSQEFYDREDRVAAEAEAARLEQQERQLRAAIEFVPTERFELAGKADPSLHQYDVQLRLREQLVDKAQRYAVDLDDGGLQWTTPNTHAEIQRNLYGMCVLEHAVDRLLDAGDQARAQNPDAIGLQRIERFEVEAGRRQTRAGRRNRRATSGIADRIKEYSVKFKFHADIATVELFLERCRSLEPRLTLTEQFTIKPGRKPGEPAVVEGVIAGVRILEDA